MWGWIGWVISSGLILSGQYLVLKPNVILGSGLMAAGVILLILIAWNRDFDADLGKFPPFPNGLVVIILILLFSVPLKVYHLNLVPYGAYNDEMVKGLTALKIMQGSSFVPFYAANKEFPFFYLVIPFIRFFGINFVALRLASVFLNVSAVLAVYGLVKKLFSPGPALCAAVLMGTAAWPNCSSHIAERLNMVPLAATMSIFVVVLASASSNFFIWVLSGMVLGGSLWTFPAIRIIPFACFGYLILMMFRHPQSIWKKFIRIVVIAAAFGLVASWPLQFNLVETAKTFYSNTGHETKLIKSAGQLAQNSLNMLRSWNYRCIGDMSFRPVNSPALWWPVGGCFVIGLVLTIINICRRTALLLLLWILAGGLPGVISHPDLRRLTAAQPVAYILAGIGLYFLLTQIITPLKKRPRWLLAPLILLGGLSLGHSFDLIFHKIAPVWRIAEEDYAMVRMAVASYENFDLKMDWVEEQAELPYRYLTWPYTQDEAAFQPMRPVDSVPFPFEPQKDVMYLFRNLPENRAMIPLITAYYPGGVMTLHRMNEKARGFYSLIVSREEVEKRRGLAAQYRFADGRVVTETLTGADKSYSEDFFGTDPLPVACQWSGGLVNHQLGLLRFALQAPPGSVMFLNDTSVLTVGAEPEPSEAALLLPAGVHPLQIQVPALGPGDQIKLECTFPDAEEVLANMLVGPPVPEMALSVIPTAAGTFQYEFQSQVDFRNESKDRFYDLALLKYIPGTGLLVANWYNREVMVLDADGGLLNRWDPNVLDDTEFDLRYKFDLGEDGDLYMIGSRSYGCVVLDTAGRLKRHFKIPDGVGDLACIAGNELYLLCPSRVYRVSGRDGRLIHQFQIRDPETGDIVEPMTMGADDAGNCYLVDHAKRRILIYDQNGNFLRTFPVPGPIEDTYGLFIDATGTIFMPNLPLNRVLAFSPSGVLLTGDENHLMDPLDSTRVHRPRYIAFSGTGTAWITNGSHQLFIFKKLP